MGQPETEQPKLLVKGMQSFKVLAECPIIVVSLFQAHRSCVHKNVILFVPLIKEVCDSSQRLQGRVSNPVQMLLLQAGPQEEAHRASIGKGPFTGVSPNVKNRAAFGEFITAQVKVIYGISRAQRSEPTCSYRFFRQCLFSHMCLECTLLS